MPRKHTTLKSYISRINEVLNYINLNLEEELFQKINEGVLKANELLNQYCTLLYQRFGTYQEVAQRTGLDPRTVKKYLRNKEG